MPHIEIDANLENLAVANSFLSEQLKGKNLDLAMIELAVEEVMVNIINYAYKCPDEVQNKSKMNKIEIGVRKIRFDNIPFFCVWIKDWGQSFDPFEEAPEPDLSLDFEHRPIGGLGVHLVKNVSNHQCYSDDNGSNVVEIFFAAQN